QVDARAGEVSLGLAVLPDAAAAVLASIFLDVLQVSVAGAAAVRPGEASLDEALGDRLAVQRVGAVHATVSAVDGNLGVFLEAQALLEQLVEGDGGLQAAVGVAHGRADTDEADGDELVVDPGGHGVAVAGVAVGLDDLWP